MLHRQGSEQLISFVDHALDVHTLSRICRGKKSMSKLVTDQFCKPSRIVRETPKFVISEIELRWRYAFAVSNFIKIQLYVCGGGIVAIRTAKWPASFDTATGDLDLQKEIKYAAHVAKSVLSTLLQTSASMFPTTKKPWYQANSEDQPK